MGDPAARFADFVRKNNNVASCTVQVATSPPSGMEIRSLPFNVNGTEDVDLEYGLESIGSLPSDAEVWLRLPLALACELRAKLLCPPHEESWVELPLPPLSRYRIGKGVIPAGSLAQCELNVRVPGKTYTAPGQYEFAIRQLYGHREVGRLTWRFGQVESHAEECCRGC